MLKKIFLLIVSLFFLGCSAIVEKIGQNKIEKGIEQYQINGVSRESIINLTEGLEYFPSFPSGIETLKLQYNQLSGEKGKVFAKRQLTFRDIEILQLYFLASEKMVKLSHRIETLSINSKELSEDRRKYAALIEKIVRDDNTKDLSRSEKISKIKIYKDLLKYGESPKVAEKIKRLEEEVVFRVYIAGEARSSYQDYDLDFFLGRAVQNSKGSKLGDYIYLQGYLDKYRLFAKNDLLLKLGYDTFRRTTLSVDKKNISEDGKKTVVIERKELLLRGRYEIIEPMTGNVIGRDYFSFDKEYELKTEREGDHISFSDEKKIVEELLEEYFEELIKYKISF